MVGRLILMETAKLSQLADALLEHAWLLCSPGEAIARLIYEYDSYQAINQAFMWGDDEVKPHEFISALAEIVEHFRSRNMDWGDQ